MNEKWESSQRNERQGNKRQKNGGDRIQNWNLNGRENAQKPQKGMGSFYHGVQDFTDGLKREFCRGKILRSLHGTEF